MLIRVMTFNINGSDLGLAPENEWRSWAHRRDLTLNTIQRYSPDLIGLQEVVASNVDDLREQLTEYGFELGHEGDEGEYAGYTSILWKQARFDLMEAGKFWFSRTPEIRSNDWGVPYPMGAAWVRLLERASGTHLLHVNTHFEDGPEGELSRVESSKLMVERIEQLAPGIPVLVTGDFNCNPWSTPYNIFMKNGFTDTYRAAGNADCVESSTIHGYAGPQYFALDWGGEEAELFWRIDWILTRDGTKRLQTSSSTIVRDAAPPFFPSDHYPVVSEVVLL